jgi:hypothetical protein
MAGSLQNLDTVGYKRNGLSKESKFVPMYSLSNSDLLVSLLSLFKKNKSRLM